MPLAMRVRSASVVLLGFLTIAFAFGTAGAQGIIELPGIVNLMPPGASVIDGQGVIWSEGSAEGGGSGVFLPFLREQKDSVENAFNTDYIPVPMDAKPGTFTHSLTFGSLATVSVGDTIYYSFRLDANEAGGDERIALDDLRIYSAASPDIADYSTLVSSGSLMYEMPADQLVLLDTSNHPGSGTTDMTVLIPTYYFETSPSNYLYLYNKLGDCAPCDSFHTSGGFEEWSAKQIAAPDEAPVVVAPFAVNGEEGGTLSFGVTASDPDSDPIESLTANFSELPVETDVSFITSEDNTAGTFHWNMGSGEAGSYDVTFTATANDLSGSAITHINVGLAGTNITGVFTWQTHAGDEGDYEIVFEATDEGGTTSATHTIHVVPPFGAPSPSAPLAPRVPLAPQAVQKGPIISGTGSTTVPAGDRATVQVSASTDNSPGAFSGVLRAARISKAASAAQTTTLTCDTSELPSGNDATFVVDNQPVISGPTSVTALPGEALSIVRPASDPDGDIIDTFTANTSALPAANPGTFTVTGPNTAPSGTLTWTPRLVDVGTYVVTFEATNRLVGPSSTTITVTAAAAARIFVQDPVKVNVGSARSTNCVYVEPVAGSFNLSEVNLSTVRLISVGTGVVTEIGLAPGKPAIIEDRDKNHIQDLTACFQKSDLNALFGLLTRKTTVTVKLQGQTTSGAYFVGTFPIEVIANGPNVGSASISPNPLNPQAKLSLNLGKGGWLKVSLYDLQGRLVRELANETNALPGPREIIVDGKDSKGAALSSGVYYFRVESADGIHNGRLAIVR